MSRRLRALPILMVLLAGARPVVAATSVEERVLGHLDRAVVDGVRPTDLHHLLLAFGWRATLPDGRVLDRGLDRLAAAPAVDPLMVDQIRRLRGVLAAEAGHPEAARELFRSQGGLEAWWAHGPQDLQELADFELRAAPPEAVAWRPVPGTDPHGWVRLAGLAWPARRQLLYLATTVVSDTEQPVALRLGAAQVARAWVNGRQALTTPAPLSRAADQAVAGAWLRQGRNVLVVAVGSESDDWWLRVRLTAPDGSRLEGVRESTSAPQAVDPVSRPAPEVRSLGGELTRALARGDDGAEMAWAAYLVDHRPERVGSGAARDACLAARTSAPAEARLLQWTVTEEPGEAARLLEEALGSDPDLHWARIALARWLVARGLHLRAATLLAEASDEPAVRATALDVDAERWLEVVLPQLEQLVRDHPRCVESAVRLADRAFEARRWPLVDLAQVLLEEAAPGLPATQALAQRRAEHCGEATTLLERLERRLAEDPNQPGLRIRVARLLVSVDRPADARAVMRTGLERCPDHGGLLMEGARLEHDLGNDPEAARLAGRLLELRPQDEEARRLLQLLGATQEDRAWRRTVDELWSLADRAPRPAPAVVVLDHHELRFLPSQLTEERVQRAVLITDADRADELTEHTIGWVPESQSLRVLAARVLRRDGTEVSARQGDTPRLSEPELNIYYDTRLRVLRFSDLEDGDLLEICYVRSETAEANETGPYKGGILFLADRVPTHLTEVTLSGREDHLPRWQLAHLSQEPERSVDDDGITHLRWTWRRLDALPVEVPPAPALLVTPHLVYSTHPDWGDLARWYERHVAPRVRASRQVESVALRLTTGVEDRRERIARLYRFVTDDIRYVGLELGEHRFRPFSADWVMTHRMGDCKDKAALLVALFGAVGIDARMVLLRTADRGPVATDLALLEAFNHAIVYLPEDDLWLDGTATGHAVAPPPGGDQGAWALVVDGASSRPETTPIPGAGLVRSEILLGRGDNAAVRLELRSEATGDAATRRRGLLAGSSDRRRLERWLQGQFPSAQVVGEPELVMVPGRDPAVVQLEATMPRGALLAGGGIPLYPGSVELASRMTPTTAREGPLLVTARPDLQWSLEGRLDRAPELLPPDLELATPHGTLEVQVRATASGYRVEGRFHLEPRLVPAAEVGALRDFLVAVERHLARPLEVP